MASLKQVIDTLDSAADSFDKIATKTQKKIYDEVINLAKDIETDSQGKVKQSIANLKRLTNIKAKLSALAKDKEWVDSISQFAQYFGLLQKQQNEYFSSHFPEHTLTETAKKKHQLMKQIAVQNTIDALIGDGLKANVTDKLNDILLRAVTTNEKFSDLQEELRAHLLGKDGGQGAFARYATTYATTALSQFTGQNNKLLTDDLDTEWFMYTGSNIETTREFCQHLTEKKYIHRSEIPTILTGKIDDHQCAIYDKTGLPYGMIEGTTPENFQVNCGGWNCRHQLVPVADAVVPADVRRRFEFAKNTRNKLQEYNDKDDKLNIPSTKGKVFATTPLASIAINTYEQLASAVQSIYTAKTNREKASILRSITEASDYKPISQVSSKQGTVFGYSAKQYDFKDENEIPKNIHLASKIANSGYDVFLVPNIGGSVSADFIIKNKNHYLYAEGKITNGKLGIQNAINNGSAQAKKIVIDVQFDISALNASNQIRSGFNNNKSVDEVWVYKRGRRIVVTRQLVNSKRFDIEFRNEWNKK